MSNQTPQPPAWLDINEAAALTGKSVSTIRRALPDIEASEPSAIRREPIEGKGGEKIFLSRAYLVKRFRIPDPEGAAQGIPHGDEDGQVLGAAAVVELLERQLSAKDRQIEALQRDGESKSRQLDEAQQNAADLAESLRQFAALNAALQNKLMALSERAGEEGARPGDTPPDRAGSSAPPSTTAPTSRPADEAPGLWYTVAISAGITLIIGLIIYNFLLWVGK